MVAMTCPSSDRAQGSTHCVDKVERFRQNLFSALYTLAKLCRNRKCYGLLFRLQSSDIVDEVADSLLYLRFVALADARK